MRMRVTDIIKNYYKTSMLDKRILSRTVKGRPIYCFCVRKSDFPKVIVTYGIHAREHITCLLALKQISDFEKYGNRGCVYFLPAVNPDGIAVATSVKPLYKANALGVDLNVNFDALWGSGVSNVKHKADSDFIGKRPFSEKETKVLRDFTLKVNPNVTVSYHAKGEEIYWEFFQDEKRKRRDFVFANAISKTTGYPLKTVIGSAGGYKDWCIQRLKIPSLTIEVGSDDLCHPVCQSSLAKIYNKNKNVIFTLTEMFNAT